MKKRFEDIDILRGFAIIVIIITHVYGLHLANARDFAIWNWLHFVVPGFLFCSGFVLASQNPQFTSISSTIQWLKKRGMRLLVPYYIYFFIHFLLYLIFPSIFSNFHFHKTTEFVIGSLFFTGSGVSLSWLPILFIELTLFSPILWYLNKKHLLFTFESLILGCIALVTIKSATIPLQNLTHWFFWLYPFILGYLISGMEEAKRKSLYMVGAMVSLGLFVYLFIAFSAIGKSLVLTHHKYPPDLFYLSYSFGLEFLVLFLSGAFLKISLLKKALLFFSKNSYRSFFVHYVVLDVVFSLTANIPILGSPALQSVLVITSTVLLLLLWDRYKHFIALKPKLSYK